MRHRSLTYWTIHKKPLTACGFLAHSGVTDESTNHLQRHCASPTREIVTQFQRRAGSVQKDF